MNKNNRVAILATLLGSFIVEEVFINYSKLYTSSIIKSRGVAKHRKHIQDLLNELGLNSEVDVVNITKGLSLTDTFWIQKKNEDLDWNDINLYDNHFDEVISKIAFDGGLYGIQMSTTSPEFLTDGAFDKCWYVEKENNKIYLMKKGTKGFANSGLEVYSEKYAYQIATALGLDCIEYEVVKFRGSLVSKCELMTSKEVSIFPLSAFVADTHMETIIKFVKDNKLEKGLMDNFTLDYLTLNTDRHANNIQIMVDSTSLEILKVAPIFDNGCSLLCYYMEEHDNLNKYIKERRPTLYSKFMDIFELNTILNLANLDFNSLTNFRFDRTGKYNLLDSRLNMLEDLIQQRIK